MVPATEMFAETVERFIERRVAGHCSREHQFAIRDEFSGVCRGGEKASEDSERCSRHGIAYTQLWREAEKRFDLLTDSNR